MEQETRPVRVYLLGFSLHQNPQASARLATVLQNTGMEVNASAWIVQGQSQNPLPFAERAQEFEKALAWQADWILDVTGGESANGVLSLLDYEGYQDSQAILAGYSDVSCVLNALSWKTGRSTLLLQAAGNVNEELLVQLLQKKNDRLCQPAGLNTEKEEILWGGNIRSFLKLAGTPYLPDVSGKPLFVEAFSTGLILFVSYLVQLEQMGVLEQCSELVIGQLTEIDRSLGQTGSFRRSHAQLLKLLEQYGASLPQTVRFCDAVGHSASSAGLWIGGRPACFQAEEYEKQNGARP